MQVLGLGNFCAKPVAAYLFHAREPKERLSTSAKNYVKWGESQCRTKTGEICSHSMACSERERKKPKYGGWYDFGEVRPCSFFTSYYGRYHRRFCRLDTRMTLDSDFICFEPKVEFSDEKIMATLACLNSSLAQAYIELTCRTSGGVVIGMDVGQAENLPIPDVRILPKGSVTKLAVKFGELEAKSRKIGGAHTRESEDLMRDEIREIDALVGRALELDVDETRELESIWRSLVDRRLSRAPQAKEFVKGSGQLMEQKPRKTYKGIKKVPNRRLDEF